MRILPGKSKFSLMGFIEVVQKKSKRNDYKQFFQDVILSKNYETKSKFSTRVNYGLLRNLYKKDHKNVFLI